MRSTSRLLSVVMLGTVMLGCCGQGFPGGDALSGEEVTTQLGGRIGNLGGDLSPVGATQPIWNSAPSGSETWGPDSLASTIAINGITESAVFRYVGTGASGTGWLADGVGDDLPTDTEAGSGTPTFDLHGPWTDDSESVRFGTADLTYGSTASNAADISTGDFVIEALIRITAATSGEQYIVGKYRTATAPTWALYTRNSAGTTYFGFVASNGPNIVSVGTLGGTILRDAWAHVILFVDRSANAQIYVNGRSGGGVAVSSSAGTWDDPGTKFMIGSRDLQTGTAASFNGEIALVQAWHRASWLDTHLQATVAKARFDRVAGHVIQHGGGIDFPVTTTRTTVSMLRICDPADDVTRVFPVGNGWIPKERSCDGEWKDPTASGTFTGALVEDDFTNLALQSADLSTTWTTVNATIDTDEAADPMGVISMDAIDGTGGDAEHGVSQAITLTAVDHHATAYARAGNVDHIYISDDTVTNAWAYFDIATCTLTSNGVGARPSVENYGNGLCRFGIGFIGTTASHTIRYLCAEADGDKVYVGAADDCYLGWMQVTNVPSPASYVATTSTAQTKNADDIRWLIPRADPGQTTVIVDAFFQEDGFDAGSKSILAYSDGGSSSEVMNFTTSADTTRNNWYDVTTNVTLVHGATPHDGERHILRVVTDVATTTGNVCFDGVCSSSAVLNTVGTDYDEFIYGARLYNSQPFANYWSVKMYDVAALP